MKSFDEYLANRLDEECTEKDRRVIGSLSDRLKKAEPCSLEFYKTLREIVDHAAYAEEDKTIKSELEKAYIALRNVIAKV